MKKIVLFCAIGLLINWLNYNPLVAQNLIMQHGNESITDEGVFYDEGGATGNYPATTQGSQTLFVQSAVNETFDGGATWGTSFLQFNFTFFALGHGDTLFIYDGPNTSSPLIGAYNSVNSPGQFTTTSKFVTFVFYSDGIADLNGLNAGWIASYAPFFTTPYVYNLSNNMISTEVSTCNALLYDSGGPTGNFAAGENNTFVIKSNLGTHVKAQRINFSVGNNVLEIFDGNLIYDAPNARRIGYFKDGYIPPEVLISSGNTMSFRFITTSTGVGFKFEISCIPEIYEQDVTESACPKVELGQYTDGPFVSIDEFEVNCLNPMIILKAEINAPGKLTNDYMIQSIPYNPPFPYYGSGMTQVPSSVDDNYLGPKPLTPVGSTQPFSFAFYGVNYDFCVPSTNGFITFNNIPYGPAGYRFNTTIPNIASQNFYFMPEITNPNNQSYNYKNSVFGVLQDTHPGVSSVPNYGVYYGHQGEYPCRTFVLSFYRLPLFSCTSDNLSTYQIVLYEGSNIIDVYVQDRTVCTTFNDGSGLLGLLNAGGNQAIVPPGRNTGTWTAHHEAWRVIPIAAPDYTIKWYKNSVIAANEIPNTNQDKRYISVSPTETTDYIAVLEYQTSSGITYTFYDTTKAILNLPPINATSSVPSVCPGDPVDVTVHAVNAADESKLASFEWYVGSTLIGTTQTLTVNPDVTTTYNVIVTYENSCENFDTVTVQVPELEIPLIVGDTIICEGERTTLTVMNAVGTYSWNTGATTQSIVASPSSTTEYTVNVATDIGCITKDTIVVTVFEKPTAAFSPNPPHVYVENGEGPISFVNLSQLADYYSWNFGDSYAIPSDNISDLEAPVHIYTRAGKYKVALTVETEEGCTDSISQFVTVEVPYFFYAPNAFTPNSDGINDYFYTGGEGIDPDFFDMSIYNKFGNLIFRSKTPFDYWDGLNNDGTKAPAGVYIYIITTQDMDGNPKRYEGSVNLIR